MKRTWAEYKTAARAKKRAAGLKAYEVWLHPSEWPLVKRYIERLAKRRQS